VLCERVIWPVSVAISPPYTGKGTGDGYSYSLKEVFCTKDGKGMTDSRRNIISLIWNTPFSLARGLQELYSKYWDHKISTKIILIMILGVIQIQKLRKRII
jgi:hypothetical protein